MWSHSEGVTGAPDVSRRGKQRDLLHIFSRLKQIGTKFYNIDVFLPSASWRMPLESGNHGVHESVFALQYLCETFFLRFIVLNDVGFLSRHIRCLQWSTIYRELSDQLKRVFSLQSPTQVKSSPA